MLIYITIRFEWRSAIVAVGTLASNILVMISFYVIFKLPVNSSFIAAILTILGYSINDIIVVFDRIRENKGLKANKKLDAPLRLVGITGDLKRTAGEIGHIIVDAGGRPCGCGSNGCLEAYASRSAIEARIMGALKKGRSSVITEYMRDDKAISSKMIRKSLEHKDELITQILFEASDYLSNGLATIINFYNPELIVLGGGLIDAVDEFYERTITKAKAKALPVPASKIQFKKAKLGDFSGVVGACFLQDTQKLKKTSNVLR